MGRKTTTTAKRNPEKDKYLASAGTGKRATYKELKRQAISLGMAFPDVVSSDIWGLISYIDKSPNKPDSTLLDKFDQWVSKEFDSIGISQDDPLRNPRLRMGFVGDEIDPETGEKRARQRRVPGLKKVRKPKREKDEDGHVKGTKKQYTWKLAQKGLPLERVTRRVKKKFPEANEKSISLWYRAAIREAKKKQM